MAPPAPAETAFEREVLPHLDAMYRVALRLTGEPANAEDLVQDSVLKAFRAWDTFRQGTNARGWLLTILRNTFINDYRRRRRAPTLVDIDVAEPRALVHEGGGSDPEGEFFHQLVDDRIIAALDALPDEFREAVVLSDVEGLGYAQIAEMVGVPVGTVKSRLFRGRRQLQAVLRDYAVEAGIVQPGEGAMKPTPMDCTEALDLLQDFLKDELTPANQDRLARHLVACGHCLQHEHFERNFLAALVRATQGVRCPDEAVARIRAALRSAEPG